jgi:hypothetical protein
MDAACTNHHEHGASIQLAVNHRECVNRVKVKLCALVAHFFSRLQQQQQLRASPRCTMHALHACARARLVSPLRTLDVALEIVYCVLAKLVSMSSFGNFTTKKT